MELDQARFHFGFRFPTPSNPVDHEALLVANRVLGGGAQGRLFKIIREERSLAYGIYSSPYTAKGLLMVAAGIDASAFEEVKEEVRAQAAQLAEGGPTEEELQLAKVGILNSMRSIGDTPGSMVHFYSREHRLGFHRTPAQRAETIEGLDVEAVRLAATTWREDLCYLLRPPKCAEKEPATAMAERTLEDAS
jgi:predicted Zn-dependent peptidase